MTEKSRNMISNISLEKMGDILNEAETILIFPHINPDGDAIGSCAALCRAMRREGKTSWILLDADVPEYLQFMDTEYCTSDKDCIKLPDVCICVDCSEESRFMGREDKFRQGQLKLCIDHHATAESFGDYYYIEPEAAATAQIVYKLLLAMDINIDKVIARSLYTGISTDTGSFQYSNTTAETHMIAAKLFEAGIDHLDIAINLYQNISYKKIKLQARILDKLELAAEGRAAIGYVTEEMLRAEEACLEDSEGTIDMLRNIRGVELAAFLKEQEDSVKVSLRAKTYGDVSSISMKFGGGGHAKAAGCTLHMPMDEAVALIRKELIDNLE